MKNATIKVKDKSPVMLPASSQLCQSTALLSLLIFFRASQGRAITKGIDRELNTDF